MWTRLGFPSILNDDQKMSIKILRPLLAQLHLENSEKRMAMIRADMAFLGTIVVPDDVVKKDVAYVLPTQQKYCCESIVILFTAG